VAIRPPRAPRIRRARSVAIAIQATPIVSSPTRAQRRQASADIDCLGSLFLSYLQREPRLTSQQYLIACAGTRTVRAGNIPSRVTANHCESHTDAPDGKNARWSTRLLRIERGTSKRVGVSARAPSDGGHSNESF
jgi:hypothetical protein